VVRTIGGTKIGRFVLEITGKDRVPVRGLVSMYHNSQILFEILKDWYVITGLTVFPSTTNY
jgi:hypothetical protein